MTDLALMNPDEVADTVSHRINWLMDVLQTDDSFTPEQNEMVHAYHAELQALCSDIAEMQRFVQKALAFVGASQSMLTELTFQRDLALSDVETYRRHGEQLARRNLAAMIAMETNSLPAMVETFLAVLTGEEQAFNHYFLNDMSKKIREISDEVGFYCADCEPEDDDDE